MFARITTGWELMKQSFRVLREDKELVVFPILSGAACMMVVASFAVPLWLSGAVEALGEREGNFNPLAYVVLFCFYVVNYFVIVFFNSALVSCAIKRMAGGDPTVGYGLSQAVARLPQIAAWALVSGTVGMLLKAIESKSEWIGKLVTSLVGAGWAIATYFVVPVLVVDRVGPIEALKRSASLMRRTWGEALGGNLGLGLVMFLAMLPGAALFMLGIALAAVGGPTTVVGAVAITIGAVWVLAASLVSATLQAILQTALYLFASEGTTPPQFDAALLQSAFGRKR